MSRRGIGIAAAIVGCSAADSYSAAPAEVIALLKAI